MSQPRLVVERAVVVRLVDDYMESAAFRTRTPCTSFKPDEMRAAFLTVAETDNGSGVVDYHAVSRIIDGFECYKMTSGCNRWTPWMRNRLNETKKREPEYVDFKYWTGEPGVDL